MQLTTSPFLPASGALDAAMLLAGIVARQAASPTAIAQARLVQRGGPALPPTHGAFARSVAAAFIGWTNK